MKKSVLELLIEKRRITQWLIVVGGTVLCIVGGCQGFLDSRDIINIFFGMVAAVLGVEISKS